MLGVLGWGNPIRSWCILHGSEKRAVLRSLTRVTKKDEQVQEALNTKYEPQGGYMEQPHIFLVADVVAQQARAGIKRWNCTSVDPVCWVCGKFSILLALFHSSPVTLQPKSSNGSGSAGTQCNQSIEGGITMPV